MSTPPPVSIDELLAQAGWVRRLAMHLARDAQSADDLAQGTMVAALESPPGSGRPLRPWLARVLTNLARKEKRGSARRERREEEFARRDHDQPPADQLLNELEQQQNLARLVSGLRNPYRTVILLHYYRGLSSAEIAASQGLPSATVRSQLARGLAQLRTQLAADSGGDPERLRSTLWLAAGLGNPLTGATGSALAASTSTTLATPSVLLMSSGTKTLAACLALAAVVTGVLGWRLLDKTDPLVPGLAAAPMQAGLEPDSTDPETPVAQDQSDPSRRAAAESIASEPTGPGETVEEVPAKETTGFYARAVDSSGLPVAGAAFASIDELGVPRDLGEATVSEADGRVHIELPRKAFFTYMGREASNTYVVLCAPGYAANFSVPAAVLGSDKDLGDILLLPGATVQGTVIDEAGSPVAGALVVGSAAGAGGVGIANVAFVTGPDREGGRPTTRTGSDGRFSLQGFTAGIGQVWAGAAQQRWTVSETFDLADKATHTGVTLVLKPLGASAMVQGFVEDPTGAPVANAKVTYRQAGTWEDEEVAADEHGAFRIAVPEGQTCRLMAHGPNGDFGPSAETIAQAGADQLRLNLSVKRVLQLLVVSQKDGSPIERASIMFRPEEDQEHFLDARWIRSDAEGRAELVLPGQPFRLTVGGTGWDYQRFGVYQPASAPTDLTVELEALPMVRGLVTANGKPVAGASVILTSNCSERFRPLSSGFPLRLFHSGAAGAKSDADGLFAIPVEDHRKDPTVLLVQKQGHAIAEHSLGILDPTKGVDGVEVELIAGGSLEGRVVVGPGRSPASVVVAISRGDGYPHFTRPDQDGHYSFSNLAPGEWRVDDRDIEPEGRVFGMAQGEENPYRWDCEVRAGETTTHDLDLRWQDDLRVEGRVTWNGVPAQGWVADLQAPNHADRPWPPRPVPFDEDGQFSIEARPGAAKLILRSPDNDELRMLITRGILVGPEPELHDFAFATGSVQGKVSKDVHQLRLVHPLESKTRVELYFELDDEGVFRAPFAPVGEAWLQSGAEGSNGLVGAGMGWTMLETIQVTAGEVTELDLTE